jgi:hypothetical protein
MGWSAAPRAPRAGKSPSPSLWTNATCGLVPWQAGPQPTHLQEDQHVIKLAHQEEGARHRLTPWDGVALTGAATHGL